LDGGGTHPTIASRVSSGDISLAVREHSTWSPTKESVILVHGYPDQQDVWDRVIAALPHEDLHIVTYDVRGAGASDVPRDVAGYRTELLVQDLAAVVAATIPDDAPVHLVGHDWGSAQLWDAVNAERPVSGLTGRIASFTSISGPSLDHIAGLVSSGNHRLRVLWQQLHSWYLYMFLIPLLPELMWRTFHRQLTWLVARSEGRSSGHWGPELPDNAAHGVNLYRANVLRRLRTPGVLRTDIPVLVLHPTNDRYLTKFVHSGLERECSSLQRVEIKAGHWVLQTEPDRVAGLIGQHIAANR
jgi:pimeloyl-ACP methyl ester carboxylesterase